VGLLEDNIGGPISTETRVNERIRVPEVRLIGPGGEQVGIVRIEDALRVAADADLDLVEVAPDAKPPVCKIMDYGKFKYETAQKARESRKNQQDASSHGPSWATGCCSGWAPTSPTTASSRRQPSRTAAT
jgi:translation initiation factor IF-3